MGGSSAPSSMGALTVGGAPVVGGGARPMGAMGGNPSGEILAMLMGKGGAGAAGAPGTAGIPAGHNAAMAQLTAAMPPQPQPNKMAAVGAGGDMEHEPTPAFAADDFPALGGGLGASALQHRSDGMGGMMQGGMMGLAAAAGAKIAQDFNMAKEDFPALPGLSAPRGAEGAMENVPGAHLMQGAQASQGTSGGLPSGMGMAGIQGSAVRRPGGYEIGDKGVPQPVLGSGDRYGLLGLLSVIQMTNPDLNTLALGTDLTTLGLNLNSTESLYSTFASPWAEGPSRREPEFSLPMCYYMQPPTLKSGHIQKFQLETLFYIFYMLPKDTLQAVAASELYSRDWKFHRDLKMWFHKQPSLGAMGADGKSGYNRPNTYIYFDVNVWERRTYYDANKNLEQGFLSEEEVRLK